MARSFVDSTIGVPGGLLELPIEYFDDFMGGSGGYVADLALSSESDPAARFSEVADAGVWLVTRDAAPTITGVDSGLGGWVRISPNTNANDFVSCQMNGQPFQVRAGKKIKMQFRVKTNDADDIKFFIGLASTDATGTTAGPILDGTNDSIGFRNVLGNTTTFLSLVEDDTNETTGTGGTLADDTFIVLGVEVDGRNAVRFYVDGALVNTISTNIPDEGAYLTPTIEVGSPTGTTATYLDVDYVWFYSDR